MFRARSAFGNYQRIALGGVLLLLALILNTTASAEPSGLSDLQHDLQNALAQPAGGKSKVSAVVLDAHTGRTLYANRRANDGFIPASNMKLLTSAVALDTYGPQAVLTTTLAIAGDDLVVIGTGDPAFGDPELAKRDGRTAMSVLDDWAAALREAGVVRVRGDVVVIDTVFDDELFHPTWSERNRRQWYGAPVAGVSFNNNCVDFTFAPTTPGNAAMLQTLPAAGGFTIDGTAETVGKDGKHAPVLDKRGEPDADGRTVYLVRGKVRQQAGPFSKPVDDPRRFLGETLKAHLAIHGITVEGNIRLDTYVRPDVAQQARVMATYQTVMTDILGRVNQDSQNMMAEALAKLNGWAYDLRQGNIRDRGSWTGHYGAAIAFLKDLGIDSTAVIAADGSGLSRDNRVSAAVLAQLLDHMLREHEHSEHYLDSLAVSGVRGSLERRLKNLTGRVYAKTGTINGVSSLSGYVFAENGRIAAFSILHNGSGPSFRRQQDRAVRALAQWLEVQPPAETTDPEIIEAMQHVGLLAPAG
ncbi:MAG: D-alanyl-D-alanine carboxypeptidase/D-alanyl-D-alanine-endopeptidase [Planctomycetota bacterium]